MRYLIISEGIRIGDFSVKHDRDNAFRKHITNGYMRDVEE